MVCDGAGNPRQPTVYPDFPPRAGYAQTRLQLRRREHDPAHDALCGTLAAYRGFRQRPAAQLFLVRHQNRHERDTERQRRRRHQHHAARRTVQPFARQSRPDAVKQRRRRVLPVQHSAVRLGCAACPISRANGRAQPYAAGEAARYHAKRPECQHGGRDCRLLRLHPRHAGEPAARSAG